MTDIPLKDALLALKVKINEVSAAPATTAEDLAMLGTAIEKIAGRVSVVEFELIAQDLTQQLQTIADDKLAQVGGASTDAVQTIADLIQTKSAEIVALAVAKEAAFNNNAVQRTTDFNSNAASVKLEALALIRDAAPGLIFTGILSAGSVTKNAFGQITRWDQGNGLVYSNITYDARRRVKSWKETLTKGDGTTLSYNFTATYHIVSGALVSVARALA